MKSSLPVRCSVQVDLYPTNPRRIWIPNSSNFAKALYVLQRKCEVVLSHYRNCSVSVIGTGPNKQLGVNLHFGDLRDFRWSLLDELSAALKARTIINPSMYGGDGNCVERHNGSRI